MSRLSRTWSSPPRIVLISLIAAHCSAFVVQLMIGAWDSSFVSEFLALSDHGISQAYAWQFFTAPFLYGDLWHFLINMIVLYTVGRDVELIIGQRQFLFLYLFGIFAGELGHLFLMPADSIVFAGSAGVAAVFIAYATILPELEMTALLLFMVPVRVKLRRVAQITLLAAIGLVIFDRSGPVVHSVFLGGAVAGWLYAHLLGFGGISFVQRTLRRRSAEAEHLRGMSTEQFLAQKIDPVLDKISRHGLGSLSRRERQLLDQARQKMLAQSEA
ncbi:MAG TPA: rhomboid family intramembrane serine protease [Chthoniobacterales bacterium]